MFLLIFAIMIDALQWFVSAALSVVMMFPGTTIGAATGCLVGSKTIIGCKAGAFMLGIIGSIPVVNGVVATFTEPVGIALGFVVSFCISASFGTLLVLGLMYCKMFYPKQFFFATGAEMIPGINLLPAWSALVVRAWLKKNAQEKADLLTKTAMKVAPSLRLPDNAVGDGMRAGTWAPDMRDVKPYAQA